MKKILSKLLKQAIHSYFVLIGVCVMSMTLNAQDCSIPIGTYPWTDDFESGLNACYQQTIVSGSNEWILYQGGYQAQSGFLGYPKEAHSGSWNLWFFSETVGSTTQLVLPKFDLGGGENTSLSFWHAQYPWDESQDILKVYYKNSIIGEWILLATYSEAVEEWTERSIVLPNPTSTYWIAFEGTANFGRGIVVDDITVNCTGCMTGCDRPVNISRIMHSPNYFDVKLVWNAPDTTGYDIQIEGYNIYNNDGSLLTANPITETFYQLTNLDPIGSYSYGVTVVYSDGCESEKAPINFTLTTPPEITMPTSGTITYSTCNGIIFDDGGQSADYSNDCNGIMIIQPDQSGFGATIQGSYTIESSNDKLYVYEGSGINGTLLEIYSGTNGNIPLTASTLGPLTLHFTSNSTIVKSGFSIHVSCTEIEDCLPPFELTADVVNASEINLTWTSSGEGDVSWNLEYGIAGFTPGIGAGTVISNIETTSYTITGTAPVSSYDVYVQTNCVDGDTSTWSAPCSFTTPCSIFTPPYFESFDDETFPPSCWTTIHTAGSGSSLWQRNTSATYIHSGAGSAKLPDQSVGNITDLVTGQLNISEANAYQITFWMYRSNYSSIKPNEGVKVWVNNTPDTIGGTELLHIRRQYTLEPIVPEIGWYEYSVAIPNSGMLYIIFQGISEYGSASYIDDIMIDAIPACPKPTDLTATIPTESSITLNWTAGGNETSWNLEYGPAGFELGSGTLVENVTNPYVLNGLTSSTEYSYYVQGNCSDGGTSNWSIVCDFATSCGSAILPLTEGFEGEDFPPLCWTTEHIAGSGSYVWQRNTTATYVHTGTASAKLPDQQVGNITILATTPLLVPEANAYQLTFWMYRSNYSSIKPNEGVKVWVNNSPDTIGGTELLYIRRQYTLEPIVPEIGWYEYSAIIPQSGTLYIVFEGISEYGTASYIDDVTVSILPSCPKPTALSANNPSETSIELSWVAAAGQSSWNLEYGPAGFEQGTGTTINDVTQNPYTLTGLSASTQYSVYIQANCAGDETSEWSSACNFATTCGLFNIPLVENFDNMGGSGSSVFPDCWTRLHTASTANPYVYTTYNFSAPACLYFYSSASNYSFAVTPELNISSINTLQVRFMGRSSNLSYHLDVGVMTDPTDIETFELVETALITATGVWEEFEISLVNYQGTGKYVAFRSDRRDESATNTFYLDDLFIEELPACAKPTDVTASNPTETSIDLTWSPNAGETSWNIQYGPTGFILGEGTIISNVTNPYTLSGLSASTSYAVYVQANCVGGGVSGWSTKCDFNTSCGFVAVPYTESFDTYGTGSNAFPPCWSRPVTYGTSTIFPSCVTAQKVSAPASLKFQSSTSDPSYAVTPQFAADIHSLMVTFQLKAESTTNSGTFEVGVMSDPTDISSFESVEIITPTSTSWTAYEVSFNNTTMSGSNKCIAFRHNTNSNIWYYWMDDVLVENIPTCPRPNNFVATDVNPRSVVLDWAAGATETSWEVEYGLSGFVHGAGTSLTATSHPFTVSNLLPETNYDFHVRALCSATETSDWESLIGITTMISCPEPSGLSIVSVTPSSATLTWTENGSATAWNLEYGLEGFTHGTGTMLTNVSNPYTINGLTAGISYHFYVQAVCGEGDLSLWVGPKKFTPGSGINECIVIGEGTTGTYTLPLNTFYKHSYSQQIITSDELMDLGAMPGSTINSVAFQYFYSTAQTKDPITIYLGEVERTAFASSTDWEPVGNMEQVFTGSVTFDNTGEDNWVEIEFDDSYLWNGENLIVAVLNNNGAYTTSSNQTFYKHTATDNISIRYQVDGSTPINLESFTSTGTRSSDRSNIRLCVISGGSSICRTPNALEATSIMANLVTLTWTPRGDETSWEVEYGPAGFIQGTGTTVSTDYYPFDITGLEPFTTYDFYVRAVCAENDYSTWKALLNITTLESCLRPSDFALAGITETTATIAWTENGGATSWNIEYGVEGFELGTGIPINHITTNPYTIAGLADATRYDCYIQSICSADNQSVWVGPISFSAGSIDCGVIGEGTVGTNSLPVNTFYNHSYTQQIFRVDELSNLGIGAGEIKSVAFQYIYSTPQTKDNITIYLCNTSKDEFLGSGDWESVDNMQVVFTGSITFDNSGEDNWVEVPFTQNFFWNGTSNLLIAVLNNHGDYTTSSNNTFYTHSTEDDLSIRYQVDGSSPINPASLTSGSSSSSRNNIKLCFVESEVPTCSRPSNVAITNSTATTAQITWSSSGATSWNIELGERGFNPTMIPTYSNISNPYTLTNLIPNVEYAFYLQSNCSGNEVSDWIGPYYFTTACDMVLDIPVTEGFENGEKPECWQNIQIEGSGNWSYQAGVIEADPQTAFEGNYNALLYSPNISITRLVTPTINLSGLTQTPILAFAYAQPSWGFGQDKLSIWVKNASTSNWSKIAEYSDNVEEWIEESIVLPDPSATYWIAFEVEGNWGHGVGLDEVKVLQEQVAPIQGNNNVCAQVTETYTTTAGMSGYVWNVLGGEITSGQGTNTITVLWGEAGNGRIDVIYDGLNYNNNVSVTIGDSPLAAVYASEEEICTGQSSVLTVVGEGNYLWSTGETTSTIVVSPSTTTTYTVLVYENQQCATELEIQIVVNAFTDIDILGNNNICYGESTVLTAVGGTQFLWTTGETSASVEVQPENTTFYSVIISNELGCSNMDSICVYVTQPPTPANLVTEVSNLSIVLNWDLIPDITKYYIYRDEQLIDSSTFNNYEDVSVMMNVEYCYAVASVVNHCESELSNTHCNTLTGIDENDVDQQIRIYPNPANANITINGNNMSQITVFNVLGQQMESNSVSNPTTMTINTSSYESGIYLIRITMKDGSEVSKRVVVTH